MSTSRRSYEGVFFCLAAAVILASGLFTSVKTYSQAAGGTFTGTVTDSSGGVLPNAQITIKNSATGVSTTTATNADGLYRVPNLLPASYEITVAARGFATVVQSGVQLTVGATVALNFSLKVGQVTEQVQVTGEAAAVELASSSLSATVSSTTVRELPLNGRDWSSLATLQPGVAVVHSQDQVVNPGGHARGLGLQMSIDGARPTQNSYRLNGVLVNDYSNAGPGNALGQNLGVDAIQEFSVLTSNYSSEYGFTSGGVINAITRSGTNTFHGSAYEFLRNNALDARNFFDYTPAPGRDAPFRRNQFGASAGGPIKKDKAFIFGDYEGLRQNKGFSVIDHTLSNNARVGILNDNNGNPLPALVGACPANSTNMAPGQASVCIDNTIQKLLTFYPMANGSLIGDGNAANYAYSSPQIVPENYFNIRGDVKISDKDSLNASTYWDHSTWSQPGPLNQVLVGFILQRVAASLEETHVFSPNFVNTLRGGYNRSTVNGQVGLSAINPAAADTSLGIAPGFYAPGFRNPGGGSGVPELTKMNGGLDGTGIQNYVVQTFQFYDDALRTMGTHSMKFGFMYLPYQDNLFAPFDQDGRAAFSSIEDMLQNNPNFLQASLNLGKIFPHDLRTKIFAGYVQDDWKVRPNLTVNLGLRYEANTLPTERKNQVLNLPTITTDPGACSAIGSVTSGCGALNNFFFASNPSTKNFEPRVGFSWDPFHNGKTAVRGGFGVFDALLLPYQLALNNAQTSPYHVAASLFPATFTPPAGCTFTLQIGPSNPCNPLALAQTVPIAQLSPLILWNYNDPNPKRNYVEQWNLNIQRQITPSTTVTVTYAGSHTWHNPFQMDDSNTVWPTLTSAGYLWPNPIGSDGLGHACSSPLAIPPGASAACQQISNGVITGHAINSHVAQIQSTMWESKAWYDALQVEFDKRMTRGLQFQVSYTWSKTEDTSSGSFAGDNFASNLSPTTPWWSLSSVKGLADFHVAQNLVINGLWNIPTPKSLSGPAGWIARGWQLGGILTLQTGVPVWAIIGNGDGDLLGQLNSEPISIPDRLSGAGCSSLVNSRSFMLANSMQYIKADPATGVPTCFTLPTAPSQAFYNANCDQSFAFPTCANLMGNNARNSIIGPGIENLDISMVKDSPVRKISESFNIQFRAEFFNILNRANFQPPNAVNGNLEAFSGTGTPVGGFGQVTSTSTPERQVQFALKVIW